MNKLEKRGGLLGVEVRAESDKRTLVGYAAVFNSPTVIGGEFREQIAPGAFAKAIGGDVLALFGHDRNRVVGRTTSGTMRMSEDAKGLRVEIDVPNTTDGNDLWALVERGDVAGMSFGFRAVSQKWEDGGDDLPLRTLLELEVPEVSATAMPAYPDTTLGKRSLDEWRSANPPEPEPEEIADPAAAPVTRATLTKARLKMDLDLKVRSTR